MLDAGDRVVNKTAQYTRELTAERGGAVIQQMTNSLIHYNHCKYYTREEGRNKTMLYFPKQEETNR